MHNSAPFYEDITDTAVAGENKNLEEFITIGDTYYKYVNDGVWFLKYINSKEAGVYLAVYGKNEGFGKETKLSFF
jgi:hypothetical protein